MIADLELRVAGQGGDHGALVGLLAGTADADGRFEHQEDIVAAILDPGDYISNLVRVGPRLVDGFAELFH